MHWESQPKRSKLPSSENCPAAGYSATAWPASVFDRMLGCPTLSVRSDFLRVAFKPFGSSHRLEIAFDFGVAPALGRQKSSRLGRDGPRLVERSPTPSPSFFSLSVSPLQLSMRRSSRFEIAFDFGVAPALGRQKSSRLGRDGPRLVERSPTPSPPFSVCLCCHYSYSRGALVVGSSPRF